jgi:putative Ca2+/H+ antiporter (TMEM165/GDT1 family)
MSPKFRTQIGTVALAALFFLGSRAALGDAYGMTLPYLLGAMFVGYIQGRCSSPFKPSSHV